MKKIIKNMAKCRACGTVAESVSRHHLCFCECGKIFVDGGYEYLRRGGNLEDIEELSQFFDPEDEIKIIH